MEDAMIINKASEERGLAHGSIYKSEFIELDHVSSYFAIDPENKSLQQFLDSDGLPFVGRKMTDRSPHYCYYDFDKSSYQTKFFNAKEECYLHSVKLCGSLVTRTKARQMACLTYRVPVRKSISRFFFFLYRVGSFFFIYEYIF